jgi:hypothetical protein
MRVGEVDWWLADHGDPASVAPMLKRALDAWRSGTLADRKSGRRKALFALHLGDEGAGRGDAPDHLLKVTRYGGLAALRRRLRGSKARTELARAEAAGARGIPTPVPLAAGEWRTRWRLHACLLLVPVLPGVEDLRARALAPDLGPAARRRLARAFGALARRLADAGVFQEDFAPNNFLVERSDPAALHVIDFERAHLRRRLGPRTRRFMLAKLHREMPDASAADRMRFLRAYAGSAEAARGLWRALEEDVARLAARDLARMARTATRGGRRFRTFRDGDARGFVYGDDPEARRLAAQRGAAGLTLGPAHAVWRAGHVSPREARRLWVRQAWLAARGLGAPPRALLRRRDGELALVAARAPQARPLADAAAEDRGAALAVLLARTLALGTLAAAPAAETVLVTPARSGVLRARWVVPPPGLDVRGRPDAGGPARARRLARTLAG